jgi:hypothetical protein
MMSWSLKKKPSHVAQVDTPRPMSSDSPATPMSFAVAPVAMMTVCASSVVASEVTVNGRRLKSTFVTSCACISVPKRLACFSKLSISGGPSMPSTKPG